MLLVDTSMRGEETVPKHIAVIMDGNGRWATKRHLSRSFGHQKGVEALERAVKWALKRGISYLTVYAFSTENWSRPKKEVQFLLSLMERVFGEKIQTLHEEGVRVRMLGDREGLSPSLLRIWKNAEEYTKENTRLTLSVAFNYGGRKELTQAFCHLGVQIKRGLLEPYDITEEVINQALYTRDYPPPDLIIRPGGEFRTSNFLLWQAAYSEWYVSETLWPDFAETDFEEALLSFSKRERRFGGVSHNQ